MRRSSPGVQHRESVAGTGRMVDVVVRMTTKVGFLTDPHVVELSEWIAARFRTSSGWMHGYVDRKSGAEWSCRSLADASRNYSWRGKSWPDDAFSRRGGPCTRPSATEPRQKVELRNPPGTPTRFTTKARCWRTRDGRRARDTIDNSCAQCVEQIGETGEKGWPAPAEPACRTQPPWWRITAGGASRDAEDRCSVGTEGNGQQAALDQRGLRIGRRAETWS